ncbi:MAG TPA: HEAT repeat domain-containing protein [Gemmataceae bacterium]|nr:HEAT repeat domain-containing protein [Gemmataceae bacterium]
MKRFIPHWISWGLLLIALAAVRAAPPAENVEKVSPDRLAAMRPSLKDPTPAVRLRAAMALAEANDTGAIPVLIDLLADLTPEQRQPVEELLTQLAGEWAPAMQFSSEDDISRRIRRDAWASWWRHTDGAALLAIVRKHTLTPEGRAKVLRLIAQLGDERFASRENAMRDLFALGRIALPQLRETSQNKDREIARRGKLLIERIEGEPAYHLPVAALRLLAVRKPAGAVEALLAYLPHAEDEIASAEVEKSLATLALPDGKPATALLDALANPRTQLRAAAAEALAKGGGPEGRSAVRKLLRDAAPEVRLRVALAFALSQEREGVPVLIDLISVLPLDQVGQIEDALYQLAGDSAPDVSPGTEPAERKKYRDAWAAWWKINGMRVDLTRLTVRPWYGFTVICNDGRSRVFEIDRHGKERWAIDNVPGPVDAVVLPRNRVLIAECNANRVTERDFTGKILWQKQINSPVNVQRFPNGNTFIAGTNQILEVDRAGKEIYTINNVPGGILAAYRSRKGVIFCLTNNGQCILLDAAGKQLKSFAVNHDGNCLGGLDLLPNDRILVPQGGRNKIVEFDSQGKTLSEVDAPGATMATKLPNGHILAAGRNTQRVFEVDRNGKVVWEHKYPGQVFRARRR